MHSLLVVSANVVDGQEAAATHFYRTLSKNKVVAHFVHYVAVLPHYKQLGSHVMLGEHDPKFKVYPVLHVIQTVEVVHYKQFAEHVIPAGFTQV